MRTLPSSLFFLLLLLAFAGCKKDDPAPTRTDYLTGVAWKESQDQLVINGYVGTKATSAPSVMQFGRDGKYTETSATNATSTGTWRFANNDTQLIITEGTTTTTLEVMELTKDRFRYGLKFAQAEIQQALNGGGGANAPLIQLILLSGNSYTFPANTPTIPPAQLASIEFGTLAVPK